MQNPHLTAFKVEIEIDIERAIAARIAPQHGGRRFRALQRLAEERHRLALVETLQLVEPLVPDAGDAGR